MNFAREGLLLVVIAAVIAVGMFFLALNRRSFPLWLLAVGLVIATIWLAYVVRPPVRALPERLVLAAFSVHPTLHLMTGFRVRAVLLAA